MTILNGPDGGRGVAGRAYTGAALVAAIHPVRRAHPGTLTRPVAGPAARRGHRLSQAVRTTKEHPPVTNFAVEPALGPTSPDQHQVGGICWVDLGVPDVDTAAAFYSALLGWQVDPPDPTGYRLAYLPDRHLVAALGPADDAGAPYWTVYARVRDAATTVQAAVAAGGRLIAAAQAAGDAGVAAAVRDPAGAPLSLWQPTAHPGTWALGTAGSVADIRLRTDRPQDHLPFLHAALGWEQHDDAFTVDGRTVATWSPPTASPPRQAPSPWFVRFHVADIDAAIQHAVALGAQALQSEPGTLLDPAGALFGLARATRPDIGQA